MNSKEVLQKHSFPYVVLGLSTTEKPPLSCREFFSRFKRIDPNQVLKTAFHEASLRTHPDKGGDAQQFKKVLRAFEYLSSKWSEHDTFYSGLLTQALEEEKRQEENSSTQSTGASATYTTTTPPPAQQTLQRSLFDILDDFCEELGF